MTPFSWNLIFLLLKRVKTPCVFGESDNLTRYPRMRVGGLSRACSGPPDDVPLVLGVRVMDGRARHRGQDARTRVSHGGEFF